MLDPTRLDANDDAATSTRWPVPDAATVRAGQPLAEIETEKATAALSADANGVQVHAIAAGGQAAIGTVLPYLGDPVAIAAARSASSATAASTPSRAIAATTRARALADRHGIDVESSDARLHRMAVSP